MEPTCHFCGASDKHRCRTDEDAKICMADNSRRIDPSKPTFGQAFGLSKKAPPEKRPQLELTDYESEVPIKVSSHWEGDPGCISITQNENTPGERADIVLVDLEGVDRLIEALTMIKNHVS